MGPSIAMGDLGPKVSGCKALEVLMTVSWVGLDYWAAGSGVVLGLVLWVFWVLTRQAAWLWWLVGCYLLTVV